MAKLKYDQDFPLRAEDFARRGMTDNQIAKALGIHRATFYEYLNIYPDFSDAIKRGKAPVDVEVENALLKRALGYEYEESMVEYKPGKESKKGKKKVDDKAKPTLIRKTQKQVIPDVTAQIVWLTNRRPALWKHRKDVTLSGHMNIKVITAVPRSNPPSDKEDKKRSREKILPREKKALEEKSEEKNAKDKSKV